MAAKVFTDWIRRGVRFFGGFKDANGVGVYDSKGLPVSELPFEARQTKFRDRDKLYDNSIYRKADRGGVLERILEVELDKTQCDIRRQTIYGYFNPVKQIVDCYANCLGGAWGKELKIAPQANGVDVNPGISAALGRIWRWSNLDTTKSTLQRDAANHGTVGIRIVARDSDSADLKRVTLQFDPAERLFDFQQDDRGNVTAVMLKYTLLQGELGEEDPDEIEVVETMTKTEFSRKYNDAEQLKDDERKNELGVCPYVILRHQDDGAMFGRHAYDGSEIIIHAINWLVGRQDQSVYKHLFPQWLVAAGGPPPVNHEIGNDKVAYVQTEAGSPEPKIQAIVPSLDQNACRLFWLELIDKLRNRQPEMNLNDVTLLSHTSGELLAQVLKPTEAVVLSARVNYDHAMIRALQIGLSEMVRVGALDLGFGSGVDAANRAWNEGEESFVFEDRPALPQTVLDRKATIEANRLERKLNLADAQIAKGVGINRTAVLKIAGMSDAEIAEDAADVIPTEEL